MVQPICEVGATVKASDGQWGHANLDRRTHGTQCVVDCLFGGRGCAELFRTGTRIYLSDDGQHCIVGWPWGRAFTWMPAVLPPPKGGFLLGVVIAAWTMYDADWNVDWPPSATTVFMIEMVLLGAFGLDRLWFGLHMSYGLYSLNALAAVAMGMQSAAARQLAVPEIVTTFLTGTLTSRIDPQHIAAISPAISSTASSRGLPDLFGQRNGSRIFDVPRRRPFPFAPC